MAWQDAGVGMMQTGCMTVYRYEKDAEA